MGSRKRQAFAGVGLAVTTVDVGVLGALVRAGVPLAAADAAAVGVAATTSYVLNRRLTFRNDPHRRWVDEPGTYVSLAAAGALVDLAVLAAVTRRTGSVAVGKAVAVPAAAAIRLSGYRRALFRRIREDQARRDDRPLPPGDVRLSVVIPAYEEEDRIADTVRQVRDAVGDLPGGVEIVVVDDGSEDATADEAKIGGADVVVRHDPNRGKGAAVRTGVLASHGRTVAFVDADLAYPPEQLERLLAEVEAGADVVVGSRRHEHTTTLVRARRIRELSGRVFNQLTSLVLLGQYRDTQCGIKAFRSDAAHLLFTSAKLDGFAFDVELFHLAERHRLALTEVPVSLTNSAASTVRVAPESVRMVIDLVRVRLWTARGAYGVDPGARTPPRRQAAPDPLAPTAAPPFGGRPERRRTVRP